ncbi:DUF3320 domain-containing protein [Nocardiopsis rhodophaea]|uniref:DUF3320 domain-containing protein n=1 Tax=Nocardiopsis rhodophaea TaxID=280238 RepID=UPI0031E321C9
MAPPDVRVREWLAKQRDELVNLSRRNKLLYFSHSKTGTLEISTPEPPVILDRLNGGRGGGHWLFHFPGQDENGEPDPEPDLRPDELLVEGKDAAQLERSLLSLGRKANQEFIDKGLWVLHLGLGTLEWRESADDDRIAVSPLILIPVTIARESSREPFRLRRTEDDPIINPALAIKLENEFDLAVPSVNDFEELGFDGTLKRFEQVVSRQKGWSVTRRAVLANFTFHKEAMYRDLLDNENELAENPLIRVLAVGNEASSAGSFDFEPIPEGELDAAVPPEELVSVLDADATQRAAILAARDGHSFVMDGPPGSGKSQTITNIIAELLAAGKTVLFVSEKAAALDVVHNRLKKFKLDEFALQLHSHSANRKAVASELRRALTKRPGRGTALTDSDRAALVQRRKALSAYAQAMNEVRHPLGRSLHQVLGRIAELQSVPQAPVPEEFGTSLEPSALAALLDTAASLGRAWDPVQRGDGFLWRDLVDAPTASASSRSEAERDLSRAAEDLSGLRDLVSAIDDDLGLGWDSGPHDAMKLCDLLVLLDERCNVPVSWLTVDSLDPLRARCQELAEQTHGYHAARERLRQAGGEGAVNLRLSHAEAADKAIASLRALRPRLDPDPSTKAEGLTEAVRFLRSSEQRLEVIIADARQVASGFGLAVGDVSLDRAAELAELGALMDSPARPEARWLDPTVQAELDEAMGALGSLLKKYRDTREDLADTFTDDVLDLDLRALHTRFTTVHRGLRKLSAAYRADKRAVAASTVSGQADARTLERLSDAAKWKSLAYRLAKAEARHAGILGGYYRREDADFHRIAKAIATAREALRLVGDEAVGAEFTEQLAVGGRPDPAVLQAARRLADNTASWRDDVRHAVGEIADQLCALPLHEAASWCASAVEEFQALNSAVGHVSSRLARPMDLGSSREVLHLAVEADRLRKAVEKRTDADAELLGELYQGVDTDRAQMDRAVSWAERVRAVLGAPVNRRVAEALLSTSLHAKALQSRIEAWTTAAGRVSRRFTLQRAKDIAARLDEGFDAAAELLGELGLTVGDIDVWVSYSQAATRLAEQGLGSVVSFCVEQRVDAEHVRPIVERALLEAWADAVLRSDSQRLSVLRAEDRDAVVSEFRELDDLQIKSAAARVITACSQRRPTSTVGVAGVIQREAQKKKRHMPIRTLLDTAGVAAQRLKPCFMMSPLSVSQYLPATMRFDVVIFDEASQVRPSDAVNCIYRGRLLIVAGDQKQLPPTSFFTSIGDTGDDSYDEDQIDDFESVLDLCKGAGALRSMPLRWHYRSRHESLITYSNYSFYGGELLTFPGADETRPDLGVELIKVDGVYRRGGARDNPVEARKVIDRVLHHRRAHPDLTLGVVTFSSAQEDAIQRELQQRAREVPELDALHTDDRIDGFFIKNLENVQGDERDIIIFSVGYGRDEHGKFHLQIPHLTRQQSERRLNVAITRAKQRVEIVSSVSAGDFRGDIRSGGLLHLKRYLDFAERGMPALAVEEEDPDALPESPFEEEVLRSIRSWGYEAQPQVGAAEYRIDIGVRHPERPGAYVLAVECDGAMYHSSKTARDRDRLRQDVLERLGWRIHRIWGPAWYRDRPAQEARLRKAIAEAIDGINSPAPVRHDLAEAVEVWEEPVDLDAPPAWTEPYRVAELGCPASDYDIHELESRSELKRMIQQAVRQEGPVHEERVLAAVRGAWGKTSAGARIKGAFYEAVDDLVRRAEVQRVGGHFLSTRPDPVCKVRVPTGDPETQRKVQHVPPEELLLAVRNAVQDAHAITEDDLTTHVAHLFGWRRRGPDIQGALEDAISELVDSGILVMDNGGLLSPPPK